MKKNTLSFYILLLHLLVLTITTTSNAQCFEKMESGGAFAILKKSDGTLWGWGNNAAGNLCNNQYFYVTPIQLCTDTDWQYFYAGEHRVFAIKTNGTLWGIGNNTYAALGVGILENSDYYTFTQIGTATNWKKVSNFSFCAYGLRTNGTLWMWGQNDAFQSGGASSASFVLSPAQIGTATDWADVAAAGKSGVAIKTNGTLWGWGSNGSGITGKPSNISASNSPQQIGTATDWAKVDAGYDHAIAQKTNGTLWGWGEGGHGQTGDGLPAAYFRNAPTQIGTDTWKSFSCGLANTFGVKSNGTLWGWGFNQYNEIIPGNTNNQMLPVQIGTDTDWDQVYTTTLGGLQTTYAIKNNGTVWAWGDNQVGQLGNGTLTNAPTPIQVPNVCVATLSNTSVASKNTLTMFPNPVANLLTIESTTALNYEIFSLKGAHISSGTLQIGANSIALEHLASGCYILKTSNQEGITENYKIMKE